jgi:hypothetical protein
MISENLQHWAELSEEKGRRKEKLEMVRGLLDLGTLSDEQIAKVARLTLDEFKAIRKEVSH